MLLEEITQTRFWLLVSVALLSLLGATVLDAAYLSDPAWIEADKGKLWFLKATTWIGVLREVGFASLIALILAVFIEQSSRARMEAAASKRQQEISENVFRGIFETDIPKVMVDEVVDSILKAKIIRLEHAATYVADDKEIEIEGSRHSYVKLRIASLYTLKNVSRDEVQVPVTIMFPVHSQPVLRDLASLELISIDDHVLTTEEIQEGDSALPNTEYEQRYQWFRPVASGGTLTVRSTFTLIKEISDNEVWTSLYPSLTMRLSVTMNCRNMEFGADALNRGTLKKVAGQGSTGHHGWELARPVLPYQGIIFWWRPKPSPDPDVSR